MRKSPVFFNERGQGLAETVVVLPVFILLLYAVVEVFHLQEHIFMGRVAARNMAWAKTTGTPPFKKLFDKAKDGGLKSDGSDLAELFLDTNHGVYCARHDTTTLVLPRMTITAHCYVDRKTWYKKINFTGIMKDILKIFVPDKMVDNLL